MIPRHCLVAPGRDDAEQLKAKLVSWTMITLLSAS
jgi:hypothetical protein